MTHADHFACPVCGTELDPAVLFSHESAHLAFGHLAAISMPLGARVLGYITMHAPEKTRLTLQKKTKLMLQLIPDLERQAITHKGRDWAAPLHAWTAAIEQMETQRAAGQIKLPLSGHGYLYAILAAMADKHEGQLEAKAEAERRGRRDTVTVQGQTMEIGQALAVVHGGVDPALAKLEADRANAAPLSDSVRARLAALRADIVSQPQPPKE